MAAARTRLFHQARNMLLWDYVSYRIANRRRELQFINWWEQPLQDNWFDQFMKYRGWPCADSDRRVRFFSVYGNKRVLALDGADVKIFFTGENLHHLFTEYRDYALHPELDLSLGFDPNGPERYLRFPLWILYCIPPSATAGQIRAVCTSLCHSPEAPRSEFAALICRHDKGGIRENILDSLNEIGSVSCAGEWKNNTNRLYKDFRNQKIPYLREFKFNICPENSNAPGYVTEKLFEAISAGCVPIYWGSGNQPEPGIINPEAVIFWDPNGDNRRSYALIEHLSRSPSAYREFSRLPRLLPSAADVIQETISALESRIKQLM
jgi:hypothetical protein